MNCELTQAWLLASLSETAPSEVEQHLAGCAACRDVYSRLAEVDRYLGQLVPPVSVDGLQRTLTQLESRPQPALPQNTPWRTYAIWMSVAASVLVSGMLGWLIGVSSTTPAAPTIARQLTPAKLPDSDVQPQRNGAQADYTTLVTKAVQHDLALAATNDPAQRIRVMLQLSEDLRGEMMNSAKAGNVADVRMLATLYRQVLAALPTALQRVPTKDRLTVSNSINSTLSRSSQQSAQLAERLPDESATYLAASSEVANYYSTVSTSTGDVSRPKSITPPRVEPPDALLAMVVTHGTMLDSDADSVDRASHLAVLADQLAHSMLAASTRGDDELAERLGEQFQTVVEQGVARQLEEVEVESLPPDRREELARLAQRMDVATETLESNLERLPAPAQAGIRRALEASRFGRETADRAARGAGPPFRRPGSGNGFVPPGLRKKQVDDPKLN